MCVLLHFFLFLKPQSVNQNENYLSVISLNNSSPNSENSVIILHVCQTPTVKFLRFYSQKSIHFAVALKPSMALKPYFAYNIFYLKYSAERKIFSGQ